MKDEKNPNASERPLDGLVICVQSRDGWCATKRRKSMEYSDNVPTLCGMVVTLPFGIKRREPDCPECLAKMSI